MPIVSVRSFILALLFPIALSYAALIPVLPEEGATLSTQQREFRFRLVAPPTGGLAGGEWRAFWDGMPFPGRVELVGDQVVLIPDPSLQRRPGLVGDHRLRLEWVRQSLVLDFVEVSFRLVADSTEGTSALIPVTPAGSPAKQPEVSASALPLAAPGSTGWVVWLPAPGTASVDSSTVLLLRAPPGITAVSWLWAGQNLPLQSLGQGLWRWRAGDSLWVKPLQGEGILHLQGRDSQGRVQDLRLEDRQMGGALPSLPAPAVAVAEVVAPSTFEARGQVYLSQTYETLQDSSFGITQAGTYGEGQWESGWFYDYNLLVTSEGTEHDQSPNLYRFAWGYRNLLRLSGGDNNPYHHPYTLNGEKVRGVELNLRTPRERFSLDIAYGYSLHAVEPWVADAEGLATLPDSSTGRDSLAYMEAGTYDRTLFATRMAVGNPNGLRWGLNLLRGRDRIGSIEQLHLVQESQDGDENIYTGRSPQDNVVLGSDLVWFFLDSRLRFDGSAAMSLFTADSRQGLESFSDDLSPLQRRWLKSFESIFRANAGTTPKPLDDNYEFDAAGLDPSIAYDAGILLDLGRRSVRSRSQFKWLRVGSNFQTLGNPWLVRDRQGFEAAQTLALVPIGGSLNLSWKRYGDNLNHAKTVSSDMDFISADFSLAGTPSRPGASVGYALTNIQGSSRVDPNAALDSVFLQRQDTRSHLASLSLYQTVRHGALSHALQGMLSYSRFELDGTSIPELSTQSILWSLSYGLDHGDWPLSGRAGFSQSVGWGDESLDFYAPSLGLTYAAAGSVLMVDLDGIYQYFEQALAQDHEEITGRLGARYRPWEQHQFALRGSASARSGEDAQYRVQADYEFRY